jgi:hypothetical protein
MADDEELIPPADVEIEPYDDGARAFGRPVIDFETIRIQAGRTPFKSREKVCQHNSLVYNDSERRVWCQDCRTTVDPYDAFMRIVMQWHHIQGAINGKLATAKEAMDATLVRRSAKNLDRSWGRKMAPNCPHCKNGLLPEDFDFPGGVRSSRSRELEEARRRALSLSQKPGKANG